jgi:hypothetical protein
MDESPLADSGPLPKRRRRTRRGRILLLTVAALLVAASGLVLYLRADKTEVFYAARGTYRGARILSSSDGPVSRTRLVELHNDRPDRGAVATAYVRTPRRLSPGYRVLLTYAGEKTGPQILGLIPERPDLILVAVQYPYERPQTPGEYLAGPYRLRQAVFRAVAGGMLALSYLQETERLSLDRVTVLGVSLGSPFGVLHGGLDPRVGTVLLVHGGGEIPATLRGYERRRGRFWRGELLAGTAAVLVESFAPERYIGRIAPRRLVMVASRRDKYFSVAGVERLFARAGEPKTLLWTDTEHVGAKKTAIVQELVELIERYLDEGTPASD